jgi:1,2-dihydroxy-3-keto-5-methylthiopentene dioxygenase
MTPNKKNLRRVLAMTTLSVYPQTSPEQPNKVLTHVEDIASTLAEVGVRFAHWPAPAAPLSDSSTAAVLTAYQAQISQLGQETGLAAVDVLSLASAQSPALEFRASHLPERSYDAEHVQLCVAGRGLLALHLGEQVFEIFCERGDLIALPAGVKHWLDVGENADFVAIRLFATAENALPRVSGDPLSARFARLEAWM